MPKNLTQVAGSQIGTMDEFVAKEQSTNALIHITDGQNNQILDVITTPNILSDDHYKSLKDTLETYEFTTFANKRFSQYLTKRNRIIIPGEDGEYIEFIIHEAIKGLNRQIEVYASASYLELKKAKVIYPGNTGSKTNIQHIADTLSGTEWQPGQIVYAGIRSFTIEQHTDAYSFLKRIANEFDLELQFRIEIDGNKVIGRYVDMLERIGEWQGREVTFGKDLLGIKRREKTGDIVTALLGLGPIQEDGTRLEVLIEDEEALKRWGRNGQHLIEVYEPITDDLEMTEERLRELTQNELEKRVNAIVEYESDIADLEHVPGMENKKIRFGDTIKIKDEKFNPPLYLEARVHTMNRSIKDKSRKRVILGDYIEYTEEEINAIWKSLQAEIAKKASMAEVVNYAEKKIPELDSPPDPNIYPKYVDISGEIPKLMLWDGEQYTAVKGDKGDPGPPGKDGIAHMGPNPPSNPAIDATWFQTNSSGEVIAIKKWNGTNWDTAKMTVDVLNVLKLSALSADLGDVTSGNIQGVIIKSSRFETEDEEGKIVIEGDNLTSTRYASDWTNLSKLRIGNGELFIENDNVNRGASFNLFHIALTDGDRLNQENFKNAGIYNDGFPALFVGEENFFTLGITNGALVLYDFSTGKATYYGKESVSIGINGQVKSNGSGIDYEEVALMDENNISFKKPVEVEGMPFYEEGEWTPTIDSTGTSIGHSYAKREGKYVRQGNLVTLFFDIEMSIKSSGATGGLFIRGLPYIPALDIDFSGTIATLENVTLPSGRSWVVPYRTGSFIGLKALGSNVSGFNLNIQDHWSSNSIVRGSVTYRI
ncbi:phage tail spike protein [Gracilibacillus dipsosauri]|uniref:phage tail spike protein n=1 Tax=Gracilibacillus dipsosauri TaxID=178340 RepID=UPI0024097E89